MEIGKILASQLAASLVTLGNVMESCPPEQWNEAHGDAPFSQVVLHTLFYCDYYLCENESEFKEQAYHRSNTEFFGDYEELEDRLAVRTYDRPCLEHYLAYCKEKVGRVVSGMESSRLEEPALMRRSKFSRLELFVYLTRHIQHHAAQLGLRVQLLTGHEMKWVSVG